MKFVLTWALAGACFTLPARWPNDSALRRNLNLQALVKDYCLS